MIVIPFFIIWAPESEIFSCDPERPMIMYREPVPIQLYAYGSNKVRRRHINY